jgi:hypothetical protein
MPQKYNKISRNRVHMPIIPKNFSLFGNSVNDSGSKKYHGKELPDLRREVGDTDPAAPRMKEMNDSTISRVWSDAYKILCVILRARILIRRNRK